MVHFWYRYRCKWNLSYLVCSQLILDLQAFVDTIGISNEYKIGSILPNKSNNIPYLGIETHNENEIWSPKVKTTQQCEN